MKEQVKSIYRTTTVVIKGELIYPTAGQYSRAAWSFAICEPIV
jgi:hypothetical protein